MHRKNCYYQGGGVQFSYVIFFVRGGGVNC